MPSEGSEAEVGEVPAVQRREWRIERWGWTLMTLMVFGGLLGVLGNGPVSDVIATSSDHRLTVIYERFVRNVGQTELVARIDTPEADQVLLRISQRYLASNQIQAMTPEPGVSIVRGGDLVFVFPKGNAPLMVRLDLRPSGGAGIRDATVSTASGSAIRLRQFVYP